MAAAANRNVATTRIVFGLFRRSLNRSQYTERGPRLYPIEYSRSRCSSENVWTRGVKPLLRLLAVARNSPCPSVLSELSIYAKCWLGVVFPPHDGTAYPQLTGGSFRHRCQGRASAIGFAPRCRPW